MGAKKLTILVVCDNATDSAYFTKTISDALPKTEVHVAKDAFHGIELAKVKEPDVILIDISINHADSLKISRIIKKDAALQMTPMLFITDLETDRQIRMKALKAGAEAFLIRPIDDAILVTQLLEGVCKIS